jgi:hypothetical protein
MARSTSPTGRSLEKRIGGKYIRTVFLTSDMLTSMRYWVLRGLLLTTVAGLTIAQTPSGPITFERIQNSNREPQNWLAYSGNRSGNSR